MTAHKAPAPDGGAHVLRPQRRSPQPKRLPMVAAPDVTYAPGHFTELVRLHNWPPQWRPGAAPENPWRNNRANALTTAATQTGFHANALGLPGAAQYIEQWKRAAAQGVA